MVTNKELKVLDCQTPLAEIQKLGQSLSINGTPTLISEDGSRLSGFRGIEDIKSWLNQK